MAETTTQFIRFILVGILNTIFGYTLYAVLIYSGLHYSIAVLAATIIAVLFNFKTYGRLVFKQNNNSKLMSFIAVYTIVYFVNVLGLAYLDSLGVDNYVGGAAMLIPVGVTAYTLNKKFVYNNGKKG
ncbi:MAG: GtrA family protein [Candidatus Altiarchaeota archaeon]|nr:GtrA family protein [Candidatus Altiarchaeota archaeon]